MLPASFSVRKIGFSELENEPNFPALVAEYAEMAIDCLPKPNFQPEIYRKYEELGVIGIFGAFDDSGLIGFASLVSSPSAHYGVLLGHIETLFVSKAKRRGGAGTKLRAFAEFHAKEVGCSIALLPVPIGGALDKVTEAEGEYKTLYRVAVKVLA